jgi:hypothetical protein
MTKPTYFAYKLGDVAAGNWHWSVGFEHYGRTVCVATINHGVNPFDFPELTEVRQDGMSVFEEMANRMAAALNKTRPGDYWDIQEDYPGCDWKYEVDNGDTLLGYWDWVDAQRTPV